MTSPVAQQLPIRSRTPQPDVPGNPFAVRVHPDACMEVGRHPELSPRCVTWSQQVAPNADAQESQLLGNCNSLHPRMSYGGPSAHQSIYASFAHLEPVCSPSTSPNQAQLRRHGYLPMYSETGLGNRHASAMELDSCSEGLTGRKNISASHASTASGLAMFSGAELGTVPGRSQSASSSAYSHPTHAAQRTASGPLGSMLPPNHVGAERRARSMVLQSSINENMASCSGAAVPRSQTMPRGASMAADMLEDQEDGVPTSFAGFSADTTSNVMGELSDLLSNPGSAGLPPGVIAGAHMHRREALSYNNNVPGNIQVPTSGSDGTVVYPKLSDGMCPLIQPNVHSSPRPVTDCGILGAGTDGDAMHVSMPARPFTDSACATGRHSHLQEMNGRMANGMGREIGKGLAGRPSSPWVASFRTGGPLMCSSSNGSANAGHTTQHAACSSPRQGSMLAEPLETLRLTPDMMYSGSFPGHMGRVAGAQQLQQVQQHQVLNEAPPVALAAALKQASQEQAASYLNSAPTTRLPTASSALQWGMHAAHVAHMAMKDERQFLQEAALAHSTGGHTHTSNARSDASQPHSGMMLPMSIDRMSEGESDFDDDPDQREQKGFLSHRNALSKDYKAVTPLRASVQGISTPDKPNPALLRQWSGYEGRHGDSDPNVTKAKSGDTAREPSTEPSGLMGGSIVVKQEDSATGEGTTSARVHGSHTQGGSMGEAEKPARRKRATGLSAEERRDRRRKSNRESARRSRVRKLEETHESESAIATLQNSVTSQAKMLSVATEHLETMKVCLSHQQQRVGNLCDGISQLLVTIRAEAQAGNVTSPVANQAAELQKTLIHETTMAARSHSHAQRGGFNT